MTRLPGLKLYYNMLPRLLALALSLHYAAPACAAAGVPVVGARRTVVESTLLGHRPLIRLRGGADDPPAESDNVRKLSGPEEWDAAMEEERLVVVDFTATWCGPCQRIAPAFNQLADEYEGSVLFLKVDIDDHGELAAELGVTSVPTFMLFRKGELVDTMQGADEVALATLISKHAAAAEAAAA